MKLTQVKGNTWVAEGRELIPFYRVDESGCILLDSGLISEREDLEQSLLAAGLTPIGILGSHVHTDHSINHSYFRKKYRIPVALPVGEAGLCATMLNLKAYLFMLSSATARAEVSDMVCPTDRYLGTEDGTEDFCGITFRILHTPGHSPDHIAVVTPDDVCYVGDAILSGDELKAKLPYAFDHRTATLSREKLRGLDCARYIVAHRGVYENIGPIVSRNDELIAHKMDEVLGCVDGEMTMDQIQAAVCTKLDIRAKQPPRAALMERNVRCYVEALLDEDRLALSTWDGVRCYRRAEIQ